MMAAILLEASQTWEHTKIQLSQITIGLLIVFQLIKVGITASRKKMAVLTASVSRSRETKLESLIATADVAIIGHRGSRILLFGFTNQKTGLTDVD